MRPGETAAQSEDAIRHRKGLIGAKAEFAARIVDAFGAVSQREIVGAGDGLLGIGRQIEGGELSRRIGRDAVS
jgi:hypothetical protein